MDSTDEKFMQTALKLAAKGISRVEPNPAVGCVIVRDNKIIGKGWHKKFGAAHAEINALDDCRKNNIDPAGSTMYVTLEPCCHHGKTPPCTDAIIKSGIKTVFIATTDPFEKVSGSGIEILKNAHIEVTTGICEQSARQLNAPFMKFASTKKTWVILKWAQSIDGFLAWSKDSDSQRWISNEKSRRDAHKLRRRSQAVLVGINTVLCDDPLLTPRPARGKKLTRIVLDSNLQIPLNCNLVKTAKTNDLLVVTTTPAAKAQLEKADKLQKTGARILPLPAINNRCDLKALLNHLASCDIQQLLVEGGPEVITAFLENDLADEICIYIAPIILASKGDAPITKPMTRLTKPIHPKNIKVNHFDTDTKITCFL
ncbi:MAG: bifunctional diaminohydroxyphosphoribosylaminopyrimidine deaminase/5-amino-6-(5-phosphoribosylamino)uracil reductase RibD [Phycisphaerae bacterium]|nr:bifunctional diaminohydroxyphosphoribosylaminopyrimidine deaminase/5-amino-6-(5-phosphoribosylamino)uracil reductase RibD [Phycisphaerae bacterium]